MKKIWALVIISLLGWTVVSCGSAPAKKNSVAQPTNTYDDTSLRQNVRKALDDADTQLPSRSR